MEDVMAWLDAHEYFLIAAAAKDRLDDLLSSTRLAAELSTETTAIAEQRAPEFAHMCDARGCALGHLPV